MFIIEMGEDIDFSFNHLKGKLLESFMKEASDRKIQELKLDLGRYDADDLFPKWLYFIRQLDEFINIDYELNHKEKIEFRQTGLDYSSMKSLERRLLNRFGKDVVDRVLVLIKSCRRTALYVSLGGMPEIFTYHTIGELLDFCNARRLHYVTMLHLIPIYSKGSKKVQHNVVEDFWGHIEFELMPIVTAFHAMVQSRCLPDYKAINHGTYLSFTHAYSQLEDVFLEPQRMTQVDLLLFNDEIQQEKLLKNDPYTLYSMKELDAIYANDAIYYEKFKLADSKIYKDLGNLIADIKPYFKDNYYIEIPLKEFNDIAKKYKCLKLICNSSDLFSLMNTRVAFIKNRQTCYSNYFLLIRYYTNTVVDFLCKNRTYQIDSGFIFEKKVRELVEKYDYKYQDECKRINHKEFDVVCVKGDCIYNFQCKNNYFNASRIDTDIVNVTSRYHKRLGCYYERSLQKEVNREHLLMGKLGLSKIEHFIISRYPVICNNDRVISYNRFEKWLMER